MLVTAKPINELLKIWQQERLITSLDRHFALEMTKLHQQEQPLFTLICALVSQHLSNQHTCLPLRQIDLNNPLKEQNSQCKIELDLTQLTEQLLAFDGIATVENAANNPLILDKGNLYLQRYFDYEKEVAHSLKRLAASGSLQDETEIQQSNVLLNQLFAANEQEYDWQKIAAATALTKKLAVITGGPGTGKTTTVTKLLYLLCARQTLTIRLVAPTGKAAARLSESIKASKQRLADDLNQAGMAELVKHIANIPEEAATLHRLLGVIPNSHEFRHNKDNPLRLDLLVIDEASMVDLPMMHKVLSALPADASLILLGDQDQLASVEAGAVLADICAGLKQKSKVTNQSRWHMRYSPVQAELLGKLTDSPLSGFVHNDPKIGDSLCMLMHSHRFQGDAGIGQLATAVNQSDLERVKQVWQTGYQELLWIEHSMANPANMSAASMNSQNNQGLEQLLQQAVTQYGHYLNAMTAAEPHSAQQIIDSFNQYRILCAMRAGEYGVDGINQSVTTALAASGLIKPEQEFYAGRPLIIQSNDYNLGLFNGDIGLILPDNASETGRLMAHFIQADGSLLKVLPARLPSHQTCYAMTVHKSQGSEFSHVSLVLPTRPSVAQQQLLSKELIYTAITRAKHHFTCLGSQRVFEQACRCLTQRASGLAQRLWLDD
ncbi:exodeoxyribonuclease V subunit alpha [Shewanella fidelis]|uniref:RecBCD enzyme subunit RecD n=1 Tax=Shewanella fidelis TaxID=173509 RepID=A0AAW8NP27_9GAMM|nr:exodeoxyribonuclease V subunit alpha [Shewanella fidelis]MDR8524085.1 exodeoxyribonuclease V subunit alpha [Shewanella fidelis]MDW4810632.1 exodeoxyribonuclease V subunit alpha [Shewanella fidelis]MDW4814753.1 exodeoxyribonuclease V subunit alpha [Shewanella fidelis]MDW4818843.1 exodeoxyribonuclease V subunit alpha [Shewanella fidelis]MDW4823480.1 exodeoxyribonuclease V subunit alpha [Shewanella fidelis]